MKDKDLKVLKRIQAKAWGKYGDKLFVEKEQSPVMRKVLEIALTKERDRFTELELDKYQTMYDAGTLENSVKEEDPETAEAMTKFVGEEIKKAIDRGELTNPNKDENYVTKTKQPRRKSKRS